MIDAVFIESSFYHEFFVFVVAVTSIKIDVIVDSIVAVRLSIFVEVDEDCWKLLDRSVELELQRHSLIDHQASIVESLGKKELTIFPVLEVCLPQVILTSYWLFLELLRLKTDRKSANTK